MGKRGPKPKPTEYHRRRGSYVVHPERENKSEPGVDRGYPVKPESVSGLSSEAWDRICGHLDSMGVLATVDVEILEAYCVTYRRWREAVERVNAEGMTYETSTGGMRRHPATAVENETGKRCTSLLSELGLTPSARSRLHAAPRQADDPVAKLLSARAG